jgi:hypothetical protein
MASRVDIWAWTYKDRARLVQEGGAKKAIVDNYQKFWHFFHNDNISAELAINEALEAARATGEIRWELHLRHWRLQHWLTQYRIREMLPEAIDLLSLAVDERVKDVPQRICASTKNWRAWPASWMPWPRWSRTMTSTYPQSNQHWKSHTRLFWQQSIRQVRKKKKRTREEV